MVLADAGTIMSFYLDIIYYSYLKNKIKEI